MMGAMGGVGYFYSKSFNEGSANFSSTNGVYVTAGYFFRHYSSFSDKVGWFMEYNVSGSYGQYLSKTVYTGKDGSNSDNFLSVYIAIKSFKC